MLVGPFLQGFYVFPFVAVGSVGFISQMSLLEVIDSDCEWIDG